MVSKAQQDETAARRLRNIELRKAGASWDEIAKQLGYADKGAACKDYQRARTLRAKKLDEAVDELRALEVERLDRLQLGLWKAAIGGDVKAAAEVRRIVMDRARLTGADTAPEVEARIREEVTASVGAQMAVLWGRVLEGLNLTPEQMARVPGLVDAAVSTFTGAQPRQRRPIDGSYVEGEIAA